MATVNILGESIEIAPNTPDQIGDLIEYLREILPNGWRFVLSFHDGKSNVSLWANDGRNINFYRTGGLVEDLISAIRFVERFNEKAV